MGIVKYGSHSSFDKCSCNCSCKKSIEEPKKLPNPDPKNYVINQVIEHNSFLLVDVRYPDCTNYEGRKLLLYKNVTWKQLVHQTVLDPHFSDNKKFLSPITRFAPSEEGYALAMELMEWS